MKIFDNDIER